MWKQATRHDNTGLDSANGGRSLNVPSAMNQETLLPQKTTTDFLRNKWIFFPKENTINQRYWFSLLQMNGMKRCSLHILITRNVKCLR